MPRGHCATSGLQRLYGIARDLRQSGLEQRRRSTKKRPHQPFTRFRRFVLKRRPQATNQAHLRPMQEEQAEALRKSPMPGANGHGPDRRRGLSGESGPGLNRTAHCVDYRHTLSRSEMP